MDDLLEKIEFWGRDQRTRGNRKDRMQKYKAYTIHRIKKKAKMITGGCIEYQGNMAHKYGLISLTIAGNRQVVPAHRALYMAIHEAWELPASIVIRHKCDNPRCVNIEHLEPGTHKDNMRDCIGRGRRAKKYKLHTRHRAHDNATIKAIKSEHGRNRDIALKYGVSNGYVSKLRSGKAKTLV